MFSWSAGGVATLCSVALKWPPEMISRAAAGSSWHLIGFTMNKCIALGYYKEALPPGTRPNKCSQGLYMYPPVGQTNKHPQDIDLYHMGGQNKCSRALYMFPPMGRTNKCPKDQSSPMDTCSLLLCCSDASSPPSLPNIIYT